MLSLHTNNAALSAQNSISRTQSNLSTSTGPADTLARAEVRHLPGAFGDPFRAIEIAPGLSPVITGPLPEAVRISVSSEVPVEKRLVWAVASPFPAKSFTPPRTAISPRFIRIPISIPADPSIRMVPPFIPDGLPR